MCHRSDTVKSFPHNSDKFSDACTAKTIPFSNTHSSKFRIHFDALSPRQQVQSIEPIHETLDPNLHQKNVSSHLPEHLAFVLESMRFQHVSLSISHLHVDFHHLSFQLEVQLIPQHIVFPSPTSVTPMNENAHRKECKKKTNLSKFLSQFRNLFPDELRIHQ